MQTTLRIDDQIYREAKAEAARLGMTLTRFIEEALRRFVDSGAGNSAGRNVEIAHRDRLMESLLEATAHFRVGERPTREALHER